VTGRPPLPIGAHGSIKTKDVTPAGQTRPRVWLAQCRVRDADGETRQVKRTGGSKTAAENALQKALSERQHVAGGALTGESRVRDAAELWFEQRQAEVDAGDLAVNTLGVYRSAWRLHVEPPMGALRLRELSVARCEAWQQALRRAGKGPSTAKSARAVLGGVLGYAARLGAIPANPVRDLSKIPGGPRRRPRALTRTELTQWLDGMAADEKAARWDIPDLTRFMLATGCRLGEALACTWDDVDLDAGTVVTEWRLIRVKGDGLHRTRGTKGSRADAEKGRTLRVPGWAVAMLMQRRVSERSGWPVFPDSLGGWKDPSNTLRVLREARDAAGFGWVTSHVFRKTHATLLDAAGLSARVVADQLGHADPSMTQRVYLGRGAVSEEAAAALEDLL
jgi:integrase